MYYRNAAQKCLALPEIIHEIGAHLENADDLLDASRVNRQWKEVLVPLRAHFPYVYLRDLSSFLLFLKSNPRAGYSCHGLRVLADDEHWDEDDSFLEEDEDEFEADDEGGGEEDADAEGEDDPGIQRTPGTVGTNFSAVEGEDTQALALFSPQESLPDDLGPLTEVLDFLADRGGLEFFMYALPGEPYMPLPDNTWSTISRMSNTLQGLYIELVGRHWVQFLTSTFPRLRYLRLFLDSDDFEIVGPNGERRDPNQLLLNFLTAHPSLEVLHIYIGKQFPGLSFSNLRLPRLRSLLLISKAENVSIATFIKNHPQIVALDVFTDTATDPFARTDLPNVQSLQVSALTASWFTEVIAAAPQRKPHHQINHLQITAARHVNLDDVLRIVAPLGPTLRCLDLIFWTRESQIEVVLETLQRVFPNIVELSLFIPSWSVSEEPEAPAPLSLATIIRSYAGNSKIRALSISDPQSEQLTEASIELDIADHSCPPNLQFVAWRSKTFRITKHVNGNERKSLAKQVTHPRNTRGSSFLRDWYEEMIFNHVAGDYDEQLKTMPR